MNLPALIPMPSPTLTDIKAFILRTYPVGVEFSLHDVYVSDLEPSDLDLYEVIESMLRSRELMSISGSLEHSADHTFMIFAVA